MNLVHFALAPLALLLVTACAATPGPPGQGSETSVSTDKSSAPFRGMAYPPGVTINAGGFLDIGRVPQPGPELFATYTQQDAARRGLSLSEMQRRNAVERRLMRKREYWWNALLDDKGAVFQGTVMDWTVDTPDGPGMEIVFLDDPFPVQTLSYYVTDSQVRAGTLAEKQAYADARDGYIAGLEAAGVPLERNDAGEVIALSGMRDDLAARFGSDVIDPPGGVYLPFSPVARPHDPALLRRLRADFDYASPDAYVQPAHRGRVFVRDGCILVEGIRGGEPSVAEFTPGFSLQFDADGYPSLLDGFGTMGVRLGTDVIFSGSRAPQPATPAQREACGVSTRIWLPEAQSQTPDGTFDRYPDR